MKTCLFLALSLLLFACTGLPSIENRHFSAEKVAADAGWQRINIESEPFVLAAFVPPNFSSSKTLTIYLEGDGLAWIDSQTPSFDPTPSNPLALKLALNDPTHQAVYLGRPCQYVDGNARRNCSARYWTSHRFAPEVVASTDHAISILKQQYDAQHLVLVGYSGGGAIAALVAARRHDISKLITVAGI